MNESGAEWMASEGTNRLTIDKWLNKSVNKLLTDCTDQKKKKGNICSVKTQFCVPSPVWSSHHLGALTSWWRGQTGPGELLFHQITRVFVENRRTEEEEEKEEKEARESERQERRSTQKVREGHTTKDPVWFSVTEEASQDKQRREKGGVSERERENETPDVLFRMSFTSAMLTSDMAAGDRQSMQRPSLCFFPCLPACVSEAPMSQAGSCWYSEAASSHACLPLTKPTRSARACNCTYGLNGNHMEKSWGWEGRWSGTAATEQPPRGQMTGLAGGHQSCNDMSVKFSFLSLKYIHPLSASFFFLCNHKRQPPALGGGGVELTYSPHHASGGVTLCQIIMWLLGEGQSDGFGEDRMDG